VSNGRLPRSELARIYHPSVEVYLRKDAAAAWNTMRMISKRYLRVDIYPGGPDSAYRTFERQQYWRDYWCNRGACGNAAVPGTSNHGLGLAVDLPSITMRTAAIDLIGKRWGWAKEWSDAQHEWWHLAWRQGIWSGPDPGTDIRNPVARRGSGARGQKWFVKKLQRRLRRHGYEIFVSGRFGEKTEKAVKDFQRERLLKADGIVGARTWRELRKKPAKKKPVPKPEKPSEPSGGAKPGPGTPKPQRPSEAPEKEQELPNKPPAKKDPIPAEVIDVSNHQGDIDWAEVRGRGIRAVYLKLSEGQDWRDRSMNEARLQAIRESRLEYGWYHFLRPKKRDAALEARFFIEQAKSLGGWGDLLPVADIEVTELSPTETADYLARFLDVLRREGGAPQILVYASPGWWDSYIPRTPRLEAQLPYCRAWIAHWGVQEPKPLKGIVGWSLHQYTDQGRVPGINTPVDMNRTRNLRELRRK
jgi:GH25 family lysozyme M1 (1,4-beta-N-acetylmuramidase)